MKYHNIVHLSDLHLHEGESVGRFNQDLIIESLKIDLKSLRDSALQPDCILFSGDLVQAGDNGEYSAATAILSSLAEAAGLTDDHVFVVPGNHDLSRQAVGPEIPRLKNFRDTTKTIDNINRLTADQGLISYASKAFAQYESSTLLYGKRFETNANFFVRQFYLRDLNLSIICLNTAFLSGAGISSDVSDEGRLVFPERALVEALRRAPAGSQILAMGHHPIPFLTEQSAEYLRPLLMRDVDLYLFGHMHRAQPEQITSPNGRCMFVQAGSLYASRDWWNGYSIISLVPGQSHVRISYRKWQEQRRSFGIASELSDDGVVYSTPEAKVYWSAVPQRVPAKAIEDWRKNAFLPFITEMLCDEGPHQASEVFVNPEFEKDRYIDVDGNLEKTTKPENINFQEAMELPDNVVVAAQPESGKTTLIRQWALSLAGKEYSANGWSIPVVVRFHEIKKYLSQFESLVKSRVPNYPAVRSVTELFESGQLTLLVDDADLRVSDRNKALVAFISKYPKNRYILLTGTPYLQGAGIAPVIAQNVPFTHLKLKKLRKSQILELIESRGTTDPAKADQLLHRMTMEAASLNVPITPVTGTFLIQIFTEDNGKPLVNRANLIERYVEIVLEKFAPQELLPSSFDYRNKSDVLAFIAEYMCRNGKYSIGRGQFVSLIESYLDRYGLEFSSVDILEYFVKARIFNKESDQISFRLSAFLSYFAALSMAENEDFRSFVLDSDRYLSFRNEISFYAAISRKDTKWLQELLQRFEGVSESVWRDAAPEVRNGTLLNNFVSIKEKANDEDIFALERRIFDAPLSESERRAVLDGDYEDEGELSQRVVRKRKIDPPATWFSQLIMLSDMLKNMELIDTSIKESVLEVVIKGWLQFTCMTLGLVPTLARDRHMNYGGIEYEIVLPKDMDNAEVARRLISYIPISAAKVATSSLGTDKLKGQLEKGIGKKAEECDPSVQFMRASILAQMGTEGLSSTLERARSALKDRRYLEEVFVRQLAEIVVRFRLPEDDLKKIRLLAANTMVDLEQGTGTKAARRRSQIITSLSSNRLRIMASDKDKSKK